MSIQLVSASASVGNPLAGTALEGAAEAGGFSGLMGLLLTGAGKGDAAAVDLAALLSGKDVADTPEAALQAVLARLMQQSTTNPAQVEAAQGALASVISDDAQLLAEPIAPDDAALPPPLPNGLQTALSDAEKRPAQSAEETAISLLGALSTPIEAPQEILLRLTPDMRGSQSAAELAGMTNGQIALALTGKDTEVLSQKSANLAADAEDFVQTLRESLLHSQPRNPLPAGVFTSATNAGGMRPDALTTPLSSSAWAQEFGEKIVWMARNDQHLARLSLYPAHLGPLSVTLNLDADKATAIFTAATQEARQAIEDALPRLREMLAAAGVALGQTDVGMEEKPTNTSNEQQAQHAALRESRRQQGRDAPEGDDETILETRLSAEASGRLRQGAGMVDLFA
ncbi:MAG: flagellar hook-length control protein FliK [Zoogloeaceae bacterium]|nr:flagellar hook-length control protein FliK [Zoogloeaceae bacterium]